MTAREKINEVVKEINELFGEDGLNALIETKDEKKFFVVLDFNQEIFMTDMIKYHKMFLDLDGIDTVHSLPAFHKNLLIWVGEVTVPSKDKGEWQNMSSEEKFEYVIHTNELEGHQFTEEEKELIRKVAFGEITSRQALEYLDKKWYNI